MTTTTLDNVTLARKVERVLAGQMRHRDSAGNEGLLGNGGVQWMTAGRGIVHSELPEQEEGRMEGFQL